MNTHSNRHETMQQTGRHGTGTDTQTDILNFWLSRDIMIFSPVIFTPGIRTLLVILLVTTLPSAHVQRALPVYISAILF